MKEVWTVTVETFKAANRGDLLDAKKVTIDGLQGDRIKALAKRLSENDLHLAMEKLSNESIFSLYEAVRSEQKKRLFELFGEKEVTDYDQFRNGFVEKK